jgi:Na+/H+ antiporter NhaD/arsenite permease-like protein
VYLDPGLAAVPGGNRFEIFWGGSFLKTHRERQLKAKMRLKKTTLGMLLVWGLLLLLPAVVWASSGGAAGGHAAGAAAPPVQMDLTGTFYGLLALNLFILAYAIVPFEEVIHLRKSKPVVLAAGIIWVLVAITYRNLGYPDFAHTAIKHAILEYGELFLFLLVAMTYINSMEERNVFETLRAWLVNRGFSLRKVFWVTGVLAFFISPLADNLTTALLMGAVVMAVGRGKKKFVALACINIVVAANAGGAFSPFGDITTLMVWQKGKVEFIEFFAIFIPSAVNWLVPAIIMSLYVGKEVPEVQDEEVRMKTGAIPIIVLFLCTIATAVSFHNFLHMPPAAGMMLGLGYLGIFAYFLKRYEGRQENYDSILGAAGEEMMHPLAGFKSKTPEDIDAPIRSLPLPAFAIDKDHKITHWNAAMEELTGFSAEDMIGTEDQWKPFDSDQRPLLADLVLDNANGVCSDEDFCNLYGDQYRESREMDEIHGAVLHFPHLGQSGKWLSFSAAPLRNEEGDAVGAVEILQDISEMRRHATHFDLMKKIARAEWDTLLFFYGVILCVGGLSQFGYLTAVSAYMYHDLGPTIANSMVGVLSAIVDNIPVMFAVLTMNPEMSHGQWLLVTLTAGCGGSMLSIGSAAGVALMGTARGTYTFGAHLKWTPVITLGYILSILCHLFLNARYM